MGQDTSLRAQFFQEALDILSNAEEIVLQLEQHGTDQEQVHSLFRLFHTLKGNSNMVGEEEINALTHALESEYDQVRTGKRALDENLLQLTFEVIDTLTAVAQEGDSQDYIQQMQAKAQELKNISASAVPGPAAPSQTGGQPEGSDSAAEAAPRPEQSRTSGSQASVNQTVKQSSGSLAWRVEKSFENVIEVGFSLWRPVLHSFFKCEELAFRLPAAKDDLPELQMDLGMEVIELRSLIESDAADTFAPLSRLAVYLEKLTATIAREQLAYNEISYELLYVLYDDFKRSMWEHLYFTGALGYKKIVTMEELNRIEAELGPEDRLWIIELAFASENSVRRSNFFSRLIEIKRGLDVPFVFISPHSHYYRKAADLISQALGSYTRIAGTLEEAVRMYILSEE